MRSTSGFSRKLNSAGATLAIALTLALPSLALAAKAPAKAPASKAAASLEGKSEWKPQKKLDFNNALVESMNERPLDSLSQLSEAERNRRRAHLYKKRTDFNPETAETVRQVRYN